MTTMIKRATLLWLFIFWCAYSQAPVITEHPVQTYTTVMAFDTLRVTATGDDLHYQWQYADPALHVDWQDAGEDLDSFPTLYFLQNNGVSVRVIVSNTWGVDTSNVMTIYLTNALPLVKFEPVNVSGIVGWDTLIYATKTGTNPVTSQWWRSADSSGTYTAVTDSTNDTLRFSLTFSDSGWYRVVYTNAYGLDTSRAVLISVSPPPSLDSLEFIYGLPVAPIRCHGSGFGDSTADVRGLLNSVACDSFLYFTDDSVAFYPKPWLDDTTHRGYYTVGVVIDLGDTTQYEVRQYYLRVPYSVR